MAFAKRLAAAFGLLIAFSVLLDRSSASTAPSTAPSPSPLGAIAVPSYVYPCFGTTTACAWYVFKQGGTIVVINPASGPDTSQNADYVHLVNTLKQNSTVTTVLGYVSTSYGNRNSSLVLSDIDAYHQFYSNIDGIFLDEGSTSCDANILAKYELYDGRVKQYGRFTALNWGTQGSECYLNETKINTYCNFEGSYATYTTAYPTSPEWVHDYAASSFWHIVYSTPTNATSVHTGVRLAKMRNAGYYYFTDALGDTSTENPYDVSPSQTVWQAEQPAANA